MCLFSILTYVLVWEENSGATSRPKLYPSISSVTKSHSVYQETLVTDFPLSELQNLAGIIHEEVQP